MEAVSLEADQQNQTARGQTLNDAVQEMLRGENCFCHNKVSVPHCSYDKLQVIIKSHQGELNNLAVGANAKYTSERSIQDFLNKYNTFVAMTTKNIINIAVV